MKQAIILAGGKGTRLQERLHGLPKPLIDICGIPLLERQILLLKKYKFEQILILVNHEANQIISYCNEKNNWGLDIQCFDDDEPLGTAGATLKIFNKLAQEFLVMYGDTMLDVEISTFYNFHSQDNEAAVTLFLHPNDHPHDSDLVEVNDENEVIAFHAYPHESAKYYPNLVNAALYWVRKSSLIDWKDNVKKSDFAKDLFPQMLNRGFKIRGYNSIEYIKDAGTPARLDKVCNDFVSGKITKSNLSHPQNAIFLDRDGTINKEVGHLSNAEQFELLPNAAQAVKLFNTSGFRTCIITNQPVVARGDCSVSELKQIHNKLETLLGNDGAFIDRIYYCPHHPDSGFIGEVTSLKKQCLCRKPNTGLIDQAVKDLNIDINSSWFIGDTTIDMLTAKRAGLKSILVETGYAGLDQRVHVNTPFIAADLLSAATFILNIYPKLLQKCRSLAQSINPYRVIHIVGLSQSGVTTFANTLSQALQERGIRNHVISISHLFNLDLNNEMPDFEDSCLIEQLTDLLMLFVGKRKNVVTLNLPISSKTSTKKIIPSDPIIIYPEDVIILDNVDEFFDIQAKLETVDTFNMICNESQRKRRIINKYMNRKYTLDEAIELYNVNQINKASLATHHNITLIDMDEYYMDNKLQSINLYDNK